MFCQTADGRIEVVVAVNVSRMYQPREQIEDDEKRISIKDHILENNELRV